MCLLRLRMRSLPSLVEAYERSLVASGLRSRKTFIVLLGIQLGIHSLEPNTEDPLWPEVSRRPFCCKELLSPGSMHIAPPVAFGLKQAIEEEVTDVLPAIRELSVSDDPATLLCFLRSHRHYRQRALRRSLTAEPIREAIGRFVTARVPAFESPSVINIGVTVP